MSFFVSDSYTLIQPVYHNPAEKSSVFAISFSYHSDGLISFSYRCTLIEIWRKRRPGALLRFFTVKPLYTIQRKSQALSSAALLARRCGVEPLYHNWPKSQALSGLIARGGASGISVFQCRTIISQPRQKSSIILAILYNFLLDFFWQTCIIAL